MAPGIKAALFAMLVATALLVISILWGAAYAFPEPDAAGKHAAELQFHSRWSGRLMSVALILLVSAVLYAVWSSLRSKGRSQD